jgi:hypothetical protein
MPAAPTTSILSSVIDAVTLQQSADGAFENVDGYSEIWKRLKAGGRCNSEGGGTDVQRQWHLGLPAAQLLATGAQRTWSQADQYRATRHPWSNTDSHDCIYVNDVRANNSQQGLVKLNKRLTDNMTLALRNKLCADVYQSNAGQNTTAGIAVSAANPVPMAGLITCMGAGSSVLGYNASTRASTGTTVAATDKEALPDMSYFGLATNPTAPPAGLTNPQPECFSPVLVNENSTAFGSAVDTWDGQAVVVLNYLSLRLQRGKGPGEQADLFVTTQSRFNTLLNSFESTYHTILSTPAGTVPNRRVGGAANLEIPFGFGVATWDQYITAPITFGINTKQMEYVYLPAGKLVIDPNLPMPREGDLTSMCFVDTQYDATQVAHLAGAQITGALICNPRFQGITYAYA